MKILMAKMVLLLMSLSIIGYAQKLPKVQETGLRAPANIKIDGKATEWNPFAAYNPTTGISYTLSNDDDRLYLSVQAKDVEIINKMLSGGLTLTIQKSADKKDKHKMAITYPVVDSKTSFTFNKTAYKMNPNNPGALMHDTSARAMDSLMGDNNNNLVKKCKSIRTDGIDNVDTLISVYNDDGIKAAGLFDSKGVYNLELLILLKHLKLSANSADKFTYNIRINGVKQALELSPGSVIGSAAFVAKLIQQVDESNARQASATDFWGEYVLVKK